MPSGGMRKEPDDDLPFALQDGIGVLIVYCILILLVDTNENDIFLLYIEWGKAVVSTLVVGDNE